MAKINGIKQELVVNGLQIGASITQISRGSVDVNLGENTGLDKGALERIALLASGGLEVGCWFDPTGAHLAFQTAAVDDVIASYLFAGGAGNPAATMVGAQATYNTNRGADASLTGTASFQSSNGEPLRWGKQLTAGLEALTGAHTTPSVDSNAATNGGYWVAHCTALTGTDVTVDLEMSSSGGGPFASYGGTSLTFTGVGAQIVEIPDVTVMDQFVRAAIAGTFTNATVMVGYAHG